MSLGGELISLIVSLTQEIGVVAGVGAITATLVGHLLSLHAHVPESVHGYVRAARQVRALALIAIIVSGAAAILMHLTTGTAATLLAPAFAFKWLLIAILVSFYFLEFGAKGVWQDTVEGFEGAQWYALFIVHTIAPAHGWILILEIYAAWLIAFGVVWAVFVAIMRHQSTLPKMVNPVVHAPVQKVEPPQAPQAATVAPVQAPHPTPVIPPMPKPVMPVVKEPIQQAPVPAPVKPVPTPAPAPAAVMPATAVPPVAPILPKAEAPHDNSQLPMIAELDLPSPHTPDPPPLPPESNLPHLVVMPRSPDDLKK